MAIKPAPNWKLASSGPRSYFNSVDRMPGMSAPPRGSCGSWCVRRPQPNFTLHGPTFRRRLCRRAPVWGSLLARRPIVYVW